jgi:hypothetical protein
LTLVSLGHCLYFRSRRVVVCIQTRTEAAKLGGHFWLAVHEFSVT